MTRTSSESDPASGEPLDEVSGALLQRWGLPTAVRQKLLLEVRSGAPIQNAITRPISPPEPGELVPMPDGEVLKAWQAAGLAAIAEGAVAAIVLAGGMATRFGGVVKAGVQAVRGRTFLDLKLTDVRLAAERAGASCPCS